MNCFADPSSGVVNMANSVLLSSQTKAMFAGECSPMKPMSCVGDAAALLFAASKVIGSAVDSFELVMVTFSPVTYKSPSMYVFPSTCRFALGLSVPIPRRASEVKVNLSLTTLLAGELKPIDTFPTPYIWVRLLE